MKLLLENWRKHITESNKRFGTLNSTHTGELYTAGLYSPDMKTVMVGEPGDEVEIISGWQDQGVEFKLIRIGDTEGWVAADALDIALEEEVIEEKDDACTRKVKSRYKVWPSAYASGALVKCRKVGAANWDNVARD